MQLLKAAWCSVLPDWKWCNVGLPNAQNNHIWKIIIVHLATLGGRTTNDSSLYSQSARKKVERKGGTPSKTCNGVTVVCETQISDEAKSRTILESLLDAFFKIGRASCR